MATDPIRSRAAQRAFARQCRQQRRHRSGFWREGDAVGMVACAFMLLPLLVFFLSVAFIVIDGVVIHPDPEPLTQAEFCRLYVPSPCK
jgi:hypothetical protein